MLVFDACVLVGAPGQAVPRAPVPQQRLVRLAGNVGSCTSSSAFVIVGDVLCV